jgi:hypothetical protein
MAAGARLVRAYPVRRLAVVACTSRRQKAQNSSNAATKHPTLARRHRGSRSEASEAHSNQVHRSRAGRSRQTSVWRSGSPAMTNSLSAGFDEVVSRPSKIASDVAGSPSCLLVPTSGVSVRTEGPDGHVRLRLCPAPIKQVVQVEEPVRIRRELREVTPSEESHEPRPAHNVLHGSRSRARPRNLHRGRLSAGQAGPVDGRARGRTSGNFSRTEKLDTNQVVRFRFRRRLKPEREACLIAETRDDARYKNSPPAAPVQTFKASDEPAHGGRDAGLPADGARLAALPIAELRGLLGRAGQICKTESGAAFSVLRWPHGENQGCGRNHARASDAGAAGR